MASGCRTVATAFDILQQLVVAWVSRPHRRSGRTSHGPRWAGPAAAAAGLLAVAALALVVVGLLNSPLRLGLALIALCVALMAAWTALSPLPSTAPGTCPPSSRPRPPGSSAASPATAADRQQHSSVSWAAVRDMTFTRPTARGQRFCHP